MSTRHPAGRGWGGATAILLIAGVVTATGLAIGHAAFTQDSPAVPANAPAAVVQTLAPTTTATTTTATTTVAPPAVTTAPVAPRALVADPTTPEDPTVTKTDPEYVDLGSGVTQRVEPPLKPPVPPAPLGAENGWDPTANGGKGGYTGSGHGPDPATVPQH